MANVNVETKLETAKPSAFFLNLDTKVDLGPFGNLALMGRVNSQEFRLEGDVNVNMFGLQMCGDIKAHVSSTKKFMQLRAYTELGLLGRLQFVGRAENRGVQIKAYLGNDGAMEAAVKDALKNILEAGRYVLGNTVYNSMKEQINKMVAAFIPIGEAEFLLDTISSRKRLSLKLDFTVLRGTSLQTRIVIPDIDIKFGGRRRLSGGGVEGRTYRHVEAYMAAHSIENPDGQSDSRRRLQNIPTLNNCPKVGFNLKDMVDRIVESIDIKQLASKMGLCIDSNVARGGKCAHDGQCADHWRFPSGAYCELYSNLASGNIFCRGTCKNKLHAGSDCPRYLGQDHDGACRSEKCLCGQCAMEGHKTLQSGMWCRKDENCYNGHCKGGWTICGGKCTPYRTTGQSCDSSKDCYSTCICDKCTKSNHKVGHWHPCRLDSNCDSDGYCDGHNYWTHRCEGHCRPKFNRYHTCDRSRQCSTNYCQCVERNWYLVCKRSECR